MRASVFLLQWLVCARRTVAWREIQAAKAIDIETQSVDLERRRICTSPKDLCGSLVDVRDDGTVEFIHATAKLYENSTQSPGNRDWLM
jgi:hypothetical protein